MQKRIVSGNPAGITLALFYAISQFTPLMGALAAPTYIGGQSAGVSHQPLEVAAFNAPGFGDLQEAFNLATGNVYLATGELSHNNLLADGKDETKTLFNNWNYTSRLRLEGYSKDMLTAPPSLALAGGDGGRRIFNRHTPNIGGTSLYPKWLTRYLSNTNAVIYSSTAQSGLQIPESWVVLLPSPLNANETLAQYYDPSGNRTTFYTDGEYADYQQNLYQQEQTLSTDAEGVNSTSSKTELTYASTLFGYVKSVKDSWGRQTYYNWNLTTGRLMNICYLAKNNVTDFTETNLKSQCARYVTFDYGTSTNNLVLSEDNNNLLKEIKYSARTLSGNAENWQHRTYQFDYVSKAGRVFLKQYKALRGADTFVSYVYDYDSSNRISKYDSSDDGLPPVEYNYNGAAISIYGTSYNTNVVGITQSAVIGAATVTKVQNYYYDNDGHLLRKSIKDASATKATGSASTADGFLNWDYQYYPNGYTASVTEPGGKTTHYFYDARGNLTRTVLYDKPTSNTYAQKDGTQMELSVAGQNYRNGLRIFNAGQSIPLSSKITTTGANKNTVWWSDQPTFLTTPQTSALTPDVSTTTMAPPANFTGVVKLRATSAYNPKVTQEDSMAFVKLTATASVNEVNGTAFNPGETITIKANGVGYPKPIGPEGFFNLTANAGGTALTVSPVAGKNDEFTFVPPVGYRGPINVQLKGGHLFSTLTPVDLTVHVLDVVVKATRNGNAVEAVNPGEQVNLTATVNGKTDEKVTWKTVQGANNISWIASTSNTAVLTPPVNFVGTVLNTASTQFPNLKPGRDDVAFARVNLTSGTTSTAVPVGTSVSYSAQVEGGFKQNLNFTVLASGQPVTWYTTTSGGSSCTTMVDGLCAAWTTTPRQLILNPPASFTGMVTVKANSTAYPNLVVASKDLYYGQMALSATKSGQVFDGNVARGESVDFTAAISGVPDQRVTWNVTSGGQPVSWYAVDAAGKLKVTPPSTYTGSYVVTAKSVAYPALPPVTRNITVNQVTIDEFQNPSLLMGYNLSTDNPIYYLSPNTNSTFSTNVQWDPEKKGVTWSATDALGAPLGMMSSTTGTYSSPSGAITVYIRATSNYDPTIVKTMVVKIKGCDITQNNICTVDPPISLYSTSKAKQSQMTTGGTIKTMALTTTASTPVVNSTLLADGASNTKTLIAGYVRYTDYKYDTNNRRVQEFHPARSGGVGGSTYSYSAWSLNTTYTESTLGSISKVQVQKVVGGVVKTTTETEFDTQGRLSKTTLTPNDTGMQARVTTYEYNNTGAVLITPPDLTATTLSAPTVGAPITAWKFMDLPSKITETRGTESRTSELTYDVLGNVVRRTVPKYNLADASGVSETNGVVTLTESALGTKVDYAYFDGFGQTLFSMSGEQNGTAFKALGWNYTLRYASGAPGMVLENSTYKQTSYFYDGFGKLKTTTTGMGMGIVSLTNMQFEVARTKVDVEYDGFGRISKSTKNGMHITTKAYDSLDRVIQETQPDGGVIYTTYDVTGQPKTVRTVDPKATDTKAKDSTFTYTYDGLGRLTHVQDPANMVVQTYYDIYDQPIVTLDNRLQSLSGDERKTFMVYDSEGKLIRQLSPVLSRTAVGTGNFLKGYDDLRRPMLAFEYDVLGRVTSTYKLISSVVIQPTTLATETLDARFAKLTLSYNNWDQVSTSTDPRGYQTQYAYDPAGNAVLVRQQVWKGNERHRDQVYESYDWISHKYSFDAAGRTLSHVYPDQTSESSSYNMFGDVVEARDRTTRIRKKQLYTLDGLLKAVQEPSMDGSTLVTTERYQFNATSGSGTKPQATYRAVMNVDADNNNAAKYEYTYDHAGRVISVKLPLTASGTPTETTQYDTRGNQISFQDAEGFVTETTYDYANRLLKRTYKLRTSDSAAFDGALTGLTESYTYNTRGDLITKVDQNLETNFLYNSQGQVIEDTRPFTPSSRSTTNLVTRLKGYRTDGALGAETTFGFNDDGTFRSGLSTRNYGALANHSSTSIATLENLKPTQGGATVYHLNADASVQAAMWQGANQASDFSASFYEYDGRGKRYERQFFGSTAVFKALRDSLNDPSYMTFWQYNKNGQLKQKWDTPRKQITPICIYLRDQYNNITLRCSPDRSYNLDDLPNDASEKLNWFKYDYTANGLESSIERSVLIPARPVDDVETVYVAGSKSTTTVTYNARGLKTQSVAADAKVSSLKDVDASSVSVTTNYTYYLDGRLNTVTDSKGVSKGHEYDARGRLVKATDNSTTQYGNAVQTVGYAADGTKTTTLLANGTTCVYQNIETPTVKGLNFKSESWNQATEGGTVACSSLQKRTTTTKYSIGTGGTVMGLPKVITDDVPQANTALSNTQTSTYTYDLYGRVSSVGIVNSNTTYYSDQNKTITKTYDAGTGALLTEDRAAFSNPKNLTKVTYTLDGRGHRLSASGTDYEYDGFIKRYDPEYNTVSFFKTDVTPPGASGKYDSHLAFAYDPYGNEVLAAQALVAVNNFSFANAPSLVGYEVRRQTFTKLYVGADVEAIMVRGQPVKTNLTNHMYYPKGVNQCTSSFLWWCTSSITNWDGTYQTSGTWNTAGNTPRIKTNTYNLSASLVEKPEEGYNLSEPFMLTGNVQTLAAPVKPLSLGLGVNLLEVTAPNSKPSVDVGNAQQPGAGTQLFGVHGPQSPTQGNTGTPVSSGGDNSNRPNFVQNMDLTATQAASGASSRPNTDDLTTVVTPDGKSMDNASGKGTGSNNQQGASKNGLVGTLTGSQVLGQNSTLVRTLRYDTSGDGPAEQKPPTNLPAENQDNDKKKDGSTEDQPPQETVAEQTLESALDEMNTQPQDNPMQGAGHDLAEDISLGSGGDMGATAGTSGPKGGVSAGIAIGASQGASAPTTETPAFGVSVGINFDPDTGTFTVPPAAPDPEPIEFGAHFDGVVEPGSPSMDVHADIGFDPDYDEECTNSFDSEVADAKVEKTDWPEMMSSLLGMAKASNTPKARPSDSKFKWNKDQSQDTHEIYQDWLHNRGYENRIYGDTNPITEQLIHDPIVTQIICEFAKSGKPEDEVGIGFSPVTSDRMAFERFVDATDNLLSDGDYSDHFLGSISINMTRMSNGDIKVKVYNPTNWESATRFKGSSGYASENPILDFINAYPDDPWNRFTTPELLAHFVFGQLVSSGPIPFMFKAIYPPYTRSEVKGGGAMWQMYTWIDRYPCSQQSY